VLALSAGLTLPCLRARARSQYYGASWLSLRDALWVDAQGLSGHNSSRGWRSVLSEDGQNLNNAGHR
jgi:hypothetical protein